MNMQSSFSNDAKQLTREFLRRQTASPSIKGSKTEKWFTPFMNHFMIIEGIVSNTQAFQFISSSGTRSNGAHLLSLSAVSLVATESEVSPLSDPKAKPKLGEDGRVVWPDNEYPQLGEAIKIVTFNLFMEGDVIRLQVLPLETPLGLQVAHYSVTMNTKYVLIAMKQRVIALLTTIEWTQENLYQLIQDFTFVGREVFGEQLFWLKDRKKMLTYSTPLEKLDGLKQVVDYGDHLMAVLSKEGPEKCVTSILQTSRQSPIQFLHTVGQDYFDQLQANEEQRTDAVERGPYLKENNPPIWNTPRFDN